MAVSVEDVLARRIGLQLFSWRLAIQAAATVAMLLRQELGWSAEEEQLAVAQYTAKVNHMITTAGQMPERVPFKNNELIIERS
jgi:glycerol-3-phosphate dehydrogenase